MKTPKTTTPPGMAKIPASSHLRSMGKMTDSLIVSGDEELEALLDTDEDKILHLHDDTVGEEQQFTTTGKKR